MTRRPGSIAATAKSTQRFGTIRERGFRAKPTRKVRACTDPDGNIFLERAQAGGANYLGTGEVRHFPAAWGGHSHCAPSPVPKRRRGVMSLGILQIQLLCCHSNANPAE